MTDERTNGNGNGNGNGRPQWPDLRLVEQSLRAEWTDDVHRAERRCRHAIMAEGEQQRRLLAHLVDDVKALKAKSREHDAFIDRLRGMSIVMTFLIGSNLALVILTALGLFVALR